MIVFISSLGNSIEDLVSARFGRCPWFIRYDSEDETFRALQNTAPSQAHGAGVAAAQILIDNGCQIAISGRFGPNAHQALAAAGIKMLTLQDESLKVSDIIQLWRDDELHHED
jgi:predicted Fe-Mo cluster-binding NifX family protein